MKSFQREMWDNITKYILNRAPQHKNPNSNPEETIQKEYDKVVDEANKKEYDIKEFTDIVDIGRDCDESVIEFIVKPTDFTPNDYKLSMIITYN